MTLAGLIILAIGASGAVAAPAWAGDPSEVVVATAPPSAIASAPNAAAPDPAGAQIQAWIHGNDDGSVESGAGAEPLQPAPRRIHGEVSAGIGSNGYSGVSGVADIPVGQNSDLVVAASRDSFGSRGFRGVGQTLSVGLFLNGAAAPTRRCVSSDQAYAGPGLPPYASSRRAYGETGSSGCPAGAVDTNAAGAGGPAD